MKVQRNREIDREPFSETLHLEHPPEVLIVDDDPNVADVLQQLLEDEGFVVEYEGDGKAALIHIERKKPDVVLADMVMPRLDGVSLLQEIQARWNGKIDVILMSASETPIGLGVPFLQKPFDLDDVISTIVNYPGYA